MGNISPVRKKEFSCNDFNEDRPNINSFDCIDILGYGGFGQVYLVKMKSSMKHNCQHEDLYALKCIPKSMKIMENSAEKQMQNEKDILEDLDHPFVLKFHGAFDDHNYAYFLTEALLGGDLSTNLKVYRRFNGKCSRFYAASVALALSYIHSMNIVHRDLKPENLVMDCEGYIKLIDFGLAKRLENGKKAYTFCGTSNYLAPEMFGESGHDCAVDYWALGVLLFEMNAGYAPFSLNDDFCSYKEVVMGNLRISFPPHFTPELIDLIKRLLKKCPFKRIGTAKSGRRGLNASKSRISDIMKHKWLREFNWNDLIMRKLDAPINPEIRNSQGAKKFLGLQRVID